MKIAYSLFGWGLVVLGSVHMFATLHFFNRMTGAALWFLSGGIAISLTGALNLLHRAYGGLAPGIRWVCIGTNLVMTSFGAVVGIVNRASVMEFVLVLGLCGGATALSLTRGAFGGIVGEHQRG